ncbi:MAG: F0F1 ATP synthase subunit B [bacterium]
MSVNSMHEQPVSAGQATMSVPTSQAGVPEGAQAHGFMDVSVPMMLWTWVAFACLVWILQRVAWRPILKGLDQREQRIRGALENAEKARVAAETAQQEHARTITEAQQQAKAIVASARSAAQAATQAAEARARTAGEALLADARREIEAATAQARQTLRQESAEIAITLAGQIVGRNLDAEQNRALTKQWLQSV